MKIKKLSIPAAIISAIVLLSSCGKISRFQGNYSFKTSGTVTMERTSVNDATKEEIKSALTSESGQMNILSKGGDSLIVTMSIIGWDVVVMEGKLENDRIVLNPFKRMITVFDGSRNVAMDMDITGSATRYDDVILYEFRYRGTGTSLSYKYTVKDSEVKCVAKANE